MKNKDLSRFYPNAGKLGNDEFLRKSDVVEVNEEVYFNDKVNLEYPDTTELELTGEYDLNNFADWKIEVDGHEMTYITSPQAGFVYPADSLTPIAVGVDDGKVLARTYDYNHTSDGEHIFKLYYVSKIPTQEFSEAVTLVTGNTEGRLLPEVDSDDNGKVLAVVDGNWQKSEVPYTQTTTLFSGTAKVEEI